MPRAKKTVLSPVEIHAFGTVTRQAKQHGDYVLESFADRPDGDSVADNARMRLAAPVRALQGLAVSHPKTGKAYLEPVHIQAANAYHADLLEAQGGMNHEIREAVDSSSGDDYATVYRLEAINKLARIGIRMPLEYKAITDAVFIRNPDKSMAAIWPNDYQRRCNRAIIKDALDWLAVEYGLKSN